MSDPARILVTPRSLTSAPPPELEALRSAGFVLVFSTPGKTPSEAELIRLVPGCVGWLAGVEPVSPAVIAAADRLCVISRNGSGADNLPLPFLSKRSIRVERALGANAIGVAELALALMLSACRHLPETAAGVRAGGWPRRKGREVSGAILGVLGMGAIGCRVARAAQALGANVVAFDPARRKLDFPLAWAGFDDVLAQAQILSLHCPLPSDGRPLLDKEALARLPANAIIVNTARAGLVDDAALRSALDEGQVGVYATDVFEPEPPASDHPLAFHDRVIATSHIGGFTDGSVSRATEMAVANLLAALDQNRVSETDAPR